MQIPELGTASSQDIQAIINSGNVFGIAGHPMRTGFSKFIVRLEYECYSPHGDENDKFQMFIIDFMEMKWLLIFIPIEDRPKAEKIAAECGLSFADGIPVCLGGPKGEEHFPIQHPNLWSVQFAPDNPAYDSANRLKLENEERIWLDEFFAEQEKFLQSQIPNWAQSLPLAFSPSEGISTACVVNCNTNKPVLRGTWQECKKWARAHNKEIIDVGGNPVYIAMSWEPVLRKA